MLQCCRGLNRHVVHGSRFEITEKEHGVSLLERSTDFLLRLAPAFAPGRETLRLWMIGAGIWADRKRCAYTVSEPYWENPLLIR